MTEPLILRQDDTGVTTLTLNAPASLNALSDAMLEALSPVLPRLHKTAAAA